MVTSKKKLELLTPAHPRNTHKQHTHIHICIHVYMYTHVSKHAFTYTHICTRHIYITLILRGV